MTYRMNPELAVIESPVVLVFPDGRRESFADGAAVAESKFTDRYRIKRLVAVDNTVEIQLMTITVAAVNPIGEETFF